MPYVQPSWAFAPRIRISNRADNIGETTLEDFEARTGVGVQYLVVGEQDFPDEATGLARAPALQADVAILAHDRANLAARQGLLSSLDHSLLPGIEAIDPRVSPIAFGAIAGETSFGLPYLWGPDSDRQSGFWVDVAVIPHASSFGAQAHQFLRFLLDPKVIADCTNYTGRANANLEAAKFVRPELRLDPRVYPTV